MRQFIDAIWLVRESAMIRLTLLAIPLTLMGVGPAAASPHYAATASIAVPDGGWDLVAVDPASRQLFVARTDSVTAVDLTHGRSVRSFGKLDRGHQAIPIPGTHQVLATSGKDNTAYLLDASDGREIARVPVGANPDAAIFDAISRRAFVMNAKDGTVSVLDPVRARVEATIPMKPGLELAAITKGRALFINNEEASEIESIDLRTLKSRATIALPGCEGPTGLAYDAKSDRLISACANGKAAIVDVRTGREMALLPIGKGPDGAMIDEARRMAFIPCGRDGILEVIALDGPGGPKVVDRIKTEVGARTGAIDPTDGAIYLPTARFDPPATPGARPTPIPGTAHLIVVAPQ
ncbi:gluconolactonase [Sphingomonas tabacisoli]|uniref:Gluconolactonase n=1 Tax=Sphingomonas tabacisoli TaxID=2249466 RepID=A0ABW4I4H5_9SPHN